MKSSSVIFLISSLPFSSESCYKQQVAMRNHTMENLENFPAVFLHVSKVTGFCAL